MTDNSVDILADTITQTHDVLAERLATAIACRPTRERPRDRLAATDPFLASASRHVSAANAVLAPTARRHLAHGHRRAQEFAHESRRLEVALAQVKGKLYGSTFVVRRPWSSIWEEVEDALGQFRALEERMADDLVAAEAGPDTDELAERLYRAEQRVPTRPHPYLPHQGLRGRVARRIAVRVDQFWDTAEGRMVPEPVRPHRSREGRMAQYLLADPHGAPTPASSGKQHRAG